MDTERRKNLRQFLDLKVRVGDTYGKSKNLSLGGMNCTTTSEVPTSKQLDIIVYFDDDLNDAIRLKGTALRCTPITKDFYDVGIYFNTAQMSNETRQKLADFLEIKLS